MTAIRSDMTKRLLLVVSDENKGDSQALAQTLKFHLHLLAEFLVERAQRLVQQQHRRLENQSPRQRHALPSRLRSVDADNGPPFRGVPPSRGWNERAWRISARDRFFCSRPNATLRNTFR